MLDLRSILVFSEDPKKLLDPMAKSAGRIQLRTV